MESTSLLLINAFLVSGWLFLFWLMSIPLRNVAIVDIAWGMGFVLISWCSAWCTSHEGINRWLLPVLVTLWGLRLSLYLLWRNHNKPEDKRYRAMREHRGQTFVYSSLWIVFGLQALLIWIVSLPVQIGIYHASPEWSVLHVIGVVLWLIGFLFETVGDYQLACFLATRESTQMVMDRGLWKYTRHPNYFGDFLVWWGFYLISLAGVAEFVWWTVIGPVIMSILLMRVSGVTLLEQTLRQSRPAYDAYCRRTSSFFPWFPRNGMA